MAGSAWLAYNSRSSAARPTCHNGSVCRQKAVQRRQGNSLRSRWAPEAPRQLAAVAHAPYVCCRYSIMADDSNIATPVLGSSRKGTWEFKIGLGLALGSDLGLGRGGEIGRGVEGAVGSCPAAENEAPFPASHPALLAQPACPTWKWPRAAYSSCRLGEPRAQVRCTCGSSSSFSFSRTTCGGGRTHHAVGKNEEELGPPGR